MEAEVRGVKIFECKMVTKFTTKFPETGSPVTTGMVSCEWGCRSAAAAVVRAAGTWTERDALNKAGRAILFTCPRNASGASITLIVGA